LEGRLSYICVAAALLATLSYTSVLTPPREYDDCQDICVGSMAKFTEVFLETQRVLSAMAPVNASQVSSVSGLSQVTSRDLFTNRRVINANLAAEEAYGPGQKKGAFAGLLQAYLVFNATALFSSLSCLVLACLLDSTVSAERTCSILLSVSAAAAYIAFVLAHFQVFYVEHFYAAIAVVLTLAIGFAVWTVYALGWVQSFLMHLGHCLRMVIRLNSVQNP